MDDKRLVNEFSSIPIAQGRTAEIFLWDDRRVLKLYREWCPPDWVEYEARIARAVHEAGIPSPKSSEIVEVNGRRGLLYERLEGKSMLQHMNARPWMIWRHARSLAEIHTAIHEKSIPGLPTYKNRLRDDICETQQITEEIREKILARLDLLPEAGRVCHGDFHPGNVLLTKTGPVVIDWMTACSGDPWADVARTGLILSIGAKAAQQVRPIIRIAIKLYYRAYLHHYRALRAGPAKQFARWMPVLAAGRLNENIIPEREALIKMVKEGLAE